MQHRRSPAPPARSLTAALALSLAAWLAACSGDDARDAAPDGGGARAEATIGVSGDLETVLRFEALRGRPLLTEPPGGMSVTWGDGRGSLFGLGGPAFTGARRTKPTFIVTITVVEGELLTAFLSSNGECRVRVDQLDETRIEGRVRCRGLTDQDGHSTVDVTGTFSASAAAP